MKKFLKSLTAATLAVSMIASADIGLGSIAVSAAETTVQESQASSGVTIDGKAMSNDYIKLVVNNTGRFLLGTTGGDPATDSDNDKKMMYGFPTGSGTSYTTIVIDDTTYIYGDDTLTSLPVFDASEKCSTSSTNYGKINVTQKLSFIKNVSTGRDDVLEIKYIIKNNDTKSHNIGTRIMIDTMLGSNDDAPFRVAGVGNVTTETEFTGDNIPQYWQAFDSLTNPTVVSQGTFLRYGDTNKPDKVQFANWRRVKNTEWNYAIQEGYSNGDSAVTVTWNSKALAAGKSITCTTYYGLSELTQDLLPPLAVSVYGDNTVTYTSTNSSGLPNYSNLAVTAYIQNIGSTSVTNATAKIVLPTGFSLASGSAQVSLGTIKVGESKQATWNVKIAGNISAGSHPIKIVCDSTETDAKTVERSVTVPAVITNNSKLSENAVVIGDTVTVTAAAKGGTGSFKYAIYYKKDSDTAWTTSQDYSSNKTVTIKPAKATKYQVLVKVKDTNGNVSDKTLTLTVNPTLSNTSKISASTITKGETVKVTASATGGLSPYTYAVLYRKTSDTSWTTAQNFASASTVSVKPAAAAQYQICVKVKDKRGTIVKKYFDVTVKAPLENTSTLSAASIKFGSSVNVKASATGGTAPYTYAVLCRQEGTSTWYTKQDFSSNATYVFKPQAAKNYEICVKVKDSKGTIVKKFLKLTVTANLTNKSTISSGAVTLGSTVTVKAAAADGTAPYTYAVLYKKKTDTQWTTKQNYSTNATISIKPAKAVEYDICVKVKDKSGSIAKKFFTLKVSELKNTSTLSATKIELGNSFTVNASATGGTAPYTYAVLYKRANSTQWTVKQDYSTNAKVAVKPLTAANYDVCVKVKDKSGIITKKFFTVTVTKSITNTSTISIGDTFKINCSATGGTAPYQYQIVYRRATTTSWTTKQKYSTNSSATLTPVKGITYIIRVDAKDSNGTVVSKTFTACVAG